MHLEGIFIEVLTAHISLGPMSMRILRSEYDQCIHMMKLNIKNENRDEFMSKINLITQRDHLHTKYMKSAMRKMSVSL